MILFLLIVAPVAYAAWSACTLLSHYRQAKSMRVPILISPVGQSNILWLLAQDFVIPYIARLPFGLGGWTRYNQRTWIWMFSDRGRIHQEYGPVIAHVTPAEIQPWIVDKDVINEILKGRDRSKFDKPREEAQNIDFLGPHLITADGDTWKRHRRVVATPFTQRNNRLVWTESLRQGVKLAEFWFQNSHSDIRTVWRDCETITMNVMVTAGFGLSSKDQQDLTYEEDGPFNFHSALSYMLTNLLWAIVLPPRLWFPKRLPPWPSSLRDFFTSVRVVQETLNRMVKDSKESARTTAFSSDNLLTALVRHSEELKQEDQGSATASITYRSSLTDDEIYSNLFGLAFAGHETVAHTLSYTIFSLAAHPEIQSWAAQEVHALLDSHLDGGIESLDLDKSWPRLQRIRAVMYETLRLFTPTPNIFKRSLSTDIATIQVGSRTLHIPPRAYVLPSLWALHSAEEYWGHDSLEWNPRRWIAIDGQGSETFTQPSPPGAFLAWSDGPRSCPGMRFSQVEFVGVCVALLAAFRISAVRLEGEDHDAAFDRVKAALLNSTSIATLMIKNPERIPIRLERLQNSGAMET